MGLDLRAKVTLDGTAFERGLRRLSALVSAGTIAMITKSTLGYADAIAHTASRLDVSTMALQKWIYAAKSAGLAAENLESFFVRLMDAASDPKNREVFARLGISPEGMTPEQLFTSFTRVTRGMSTTRIRETLAELGMSPIRVGRMVEFLQSDIESLGQAAERMGAVMAEDTVRILSQVNNQLAVLSQTLYSQVGPGLVWFGKKLIETIAFIRGGAGWVGAATSRLSSRDIITSLITNPIPWTLPGIRSRANIIKQLFATGKPEIETAWEEFAREIEKGQELLSAIENPPSALEPGRIGTVQPRAARERALRGEQIYSDALVAVGNFLGAGRGLIYGVEKQLQQLNRIASNTHRTAELLERWGADSIIIPET